MKLILTKSSSIAFVCNMVLAYLLYAVCRVEFVIENWNMYSDTLFDNSLVDLLTGCLLFDTSAILYTNLIYAVMMLFPLHTKENRVWQRVAKWVFIVVNGVCLAANIIDSVYVQYTGRRTTMSVFSEFGNEGNLGTILGTELLHHWYLVIVVVLMVVVMWRLYVMPECRHIRDGYLRYYTANTVAFLVFIPLCVAGMRGGFTTAVRPVTISNANQYVNRPVEAAVILNTPFSMIRTVGKTAFVVPEYFTEEELNAIYSPVHSVKENTNNPDGCPLRGMGGQNVVVLIVESFGREFIGAYNEKLDGGSYKGYAPFVDSLYSQSLSFDYTFANGRKSIDGMPSVLSSIPMFVEPFFLTPASLNDLSGIAGELDKMGYETAFFHGAENGSMGFQAFARATGFQHYYGRTEYNADSRFGGDKDFDGTWAIWDEPFLQFYAQKMSEMKEPFMTAVFTASSHSPFVVPEAYKDIYPEEGGNALHKCIRYTDNALRQFFETASKQPWYRNTLFVFTSDHTNSPDHIEYMNELGVFGSPILFYDPSGTIKAERRHCIAQQIDIMPTVLGYLGYKSPYVAFGTNLFATADEDTWAVQYVNGIYQYERGDYVLQFDAANNRIRGLYNFKDDWLMTHDLKEQMPKVTEDLLLRLKAVIQSYMTRMNSNKLIVDTP